MSALPASSLRRLDGRIAAIGLAVLCAGLIAAGALIEQQPIVAAAALVAIPAAVILFLRPELAVPVVLFTMYTNAAVVAVRFHGVPGIAAMLVPMPLLLPLLHQGKVFRLPIVVTPALPWILAFVGWQLICALLSADQVKSVNGVLGTVLEGLSIYLLLTNIVRTPQIMRLGIWGLMAAGAFMGSVSVYQQATRSFDSNLGGFGQVSENEGFAVAEGHAVVHQRRLGGPIGEKNRYAQVMLMLVPLALSRFYAERTISLRLLALAACALAGLGGGLTFSRSGAIAFVLMLLVGVALRFITRRQILIAALGGFFLLLAIPQYRTRLATVPTVLGIFGTGAGAAEPDGAIRGRATEMLAGGRIAMDHPVFGVGPDLSGEYTREYGQIGGLRALEGPRETHCLFLEVAAETGFPGLGLFLGMLSTSIVTLFQVRKRAHGRDHEMEQSSAGFLLALTGYLTMGIFLHMSYIRYFWLMLGLADACHHTAKCVDGTAARPMAQEVHA